MEKDEKTYSEYNATYEYKSLSVVNRINYSLKMLSDNNFRTSTKENLLELNKRE